VTQAGARNEGKIHLGFVYANDPSFETSALLAQGALSFDAALGRWLEASLEDVGLSTPHHYAVHRDSLLGVDAVLAPFARVRDVVRELGAAKRCRYLGQDARTIDFARLSLDGIYDPATVAAVVRTDERGVDVKALALCLRNRVAAEPRIRFHRCTEITGASRAGRSITIAFTRDGVASTRPYPQVINCLWDGKLAIDRSMRFLPPYRSSYRLKYGVNVVLKHPDRSVPSTTVVVGPFGDIVRLDDRRLYLSWYPIARAGMSAALAPPDWPRELGGGEARRMIDLTLDAFAQLVKPVRALHPDLFEEASVEGAIILAAGQTDIDNPRSRLHTRTAVGIRSADGYHSVDTGKYTLAPMWAIQVADRVCGTS
jgi:hypothetical protein